MKSPSHQRGPLPATGIQDLLEQKQAIRKAAEGKIPEPLLQSTIQTVMRLSSRQASGRAPARVLCLVRHALKKIAQRKWKPDTAVLLGNASRRKEDNLHGAAE
jgi:hypothetical protein